MVSKTKARTGKDDKHMAVPVETDTSWHPRRFRDFFSIPDRYVDMFYGEIPDVEIVDRKDSITVKVDLPEIDSKDLKVEIGEMNVVIQGVSTHTEHKRTQGYSYSSHSSSRYYRNVPLPAKVVKKTAKKSFYGHTLIVELKKQK